MIKQLFGVLVGLVLGHIIIGINAIMFVVVLIMKIVLPERLYWRNIKHVFTQYHWNWLLFKWGRIKIVYEGDTESLKQGESALMISNHQDDLDLGVFIIVYQNQGIRSTETKWISKRSIAFFPFFGWVHYLIGDLYLARNFDTDADNIRLWLSKFKERCFKRIVIFPEGTRTTQKKIEASQQFARENNLTPLNNVLIPRTKGFALIAKYCRDNPGTIDYIYDYTFGYGGGGVGVWTFLQGPVYTDIHVHVTRHSIRDIGTDREDFAQWCAKRFQIKDRLLDHFNKNGRFPNGKETVKMERDFEKGKAKVR